MTTPLKIEHPRDLVSARICVLYQGAPFTGKTTYAVSWPKPCILQCDPNRALPANTPPDATVITVQDWKHFEYEVLPHFVEGKSECETVIVDSLTYLGKMVERDVGIVGAVKEIDKYTRYRIAFGNAMLKLLHVARRATPRPYHVVCTVHETEGSDFLTGAVTGISLSLVGALKDQAAGWFDVVLVTQARPGLPEIKPGAKEATLGPARYFVLTQPTNLRDKVGDRLGGNRFPGTLPHECDGSYPSLAKLWQIPNHNQTR